MDCGAVLCEGEIIREHIFGEYWGATYTEVRQCCPYCRGNLIDGGFCEICGKCIDERDLVIKDGTRMCLDCVCEEVFL